MLTVQDFDAMYREDRFAGFGYLGERARAEQSTAEADARALEAANASGMTYEDLFAWANSKHGRWYGDCMFGSNGLHAERYLPTRTPAPFSA